MLPYITITEIIEAKPTSLFYNVSTICHSSIKASRHESSPGSCTKDINFVPLYASRLPRSGWRSEVLNWEKLHDLILQMSVNVSQ